METPDGNIFYSLTENEGFWKNNILVDYFHYQCNLRNFPRDLIYLVNDYCTPPKNQFVMKSDQLGFSYFLFSTENKIKINKMIQYLRQKSDREIHFYQNEKCWVNISRLSWNHLKKKLIKDGLSENENGSNLGDYFKAVHDYIWHNQLHPLNGLQG